MEKDADQGPIDTNLEEECQASVTTETDTEQGHTGTNNLEEDDQDSATCAIISGGWSEEPTAAASTTAQAASGTSKAEPRSQR